MGKLMSPRAYRKRTETTPKAFMLDRLRQSGLRVPDFWIYVPDDGEPPTEDDLAPLPSGAEFAVRSAANVEDGSSASFAGQFDTILGVRGANAIIEAARKVLNGVNNTRAASYSREGILPPKLHVIIQHMVEGRQSGVVFSKNPMTGLNEIVIESIAGRGEKLVDKGFDPDRYVWRGNGLISSPDTPQLPDQVVSELAETASHIATKFGRPMDMEWTWDGTFVHWLQARPITGLENARLYSNRISREVMPGMITPLVWSINVPAVNGAWIEFLERAVGPSGLQPADLAKQFAFRSYFNMTALGKIFELLGMPADALEVMLGLPNTPRPRFSAPQKLLLRVPRLLSVAVFLLSYEKRFNRELTEINLEVEKGERTKASELSATELLQGIKALLPKIKRAASPNIIAPILANVYGSLLRQRLTSKGRDYSSIDFTIGVEAFNDYDPKPLLHALGQSLREGSKQPDPLDRLLSRFGHLSENTNDLALPTWREQVEHVRSMAKCMADVETERPRLSQSLDAMLTGCGPITKWLGGRAQRFQLHREAISYSYARLYGQLRPLILELGKRLTELEKLNEPDDIFLLDIAETDTLVQCPGGTDVKQRIADRNREFDSVRDARMPETIFSDEFIPLPAVTGTDLDRKTGVGVSRGQARGPLRILKGFEDFSKVQNGDIIVIPFSDVGWTPVFAKAGGVISEAGGMLSHCAIVAREYAIPCVASVEGAMLLPDGVEAMIDATSGIVMVLEDTSAA